MAADTTCQSGVVRRQSRRAAADVNRLFLLVAYLRGVTTLGYGHHAAGDCRMADRMPPGRALTWAAHGTNSVVFGRARLAGDRDRFCLPRSAARVTRPAPPGFPSTYAWPT